MRDLTALRDELIGAAPWYDDARPDYTEFDAILAGAFVFDEVALRDLIRAARPVPVADENGDVHCLRLWPIQRCQYVNGHYGGCSPR